MRNSIQKLNLKSSVVQDALEQIEEFEENISEYEYGYDY